MAEQGKTGFNSQFQDGTFMHQTPLQPPDALPSTGLTYQAPHGHKKWVMDMSFSNTISSPRKMEEGIRYKNCLHSEVQT